jgi:hypothetical protein
MAWIKQIPVWVWLLLAVWQLPRSAVLGMSLYSPMALTRSIALTTVFLVLASCRFWYWGRAHEGKAGQSEMPDL